MMNAMNLPYPRGGASDRAGGKDLYGQEEFCLDLQQGHKRAGVQRWERDRDHADHGPEGIGSFLRKRPIAGADGALDEVPSAECRSPMIAVGSEECEKALPPRVFLSFASV
jgi:hypothetical protein